MFDKKVLDLIMFKEWDKFLGLEDCLQPIKDQAGAITGKAATLSCIPAIFANLLSALLAFAGLTALIMFIMGSFKFMNAEGDPKKIQAAENNFKFGIIGFSIVAASFLIINIISIVTNVQCIKTFGFGCN